VTFGGDGDGTLAGMSLFPNTVVPAQWRAAGLSLRLAARIAELVAERRKARRRAQLRRIVRRVLVASVVAGAAIKGGRALGALRR
jgi:hypothetical protein